MGTIVIYTRQGGRTMTTNTSETFGEKNMPSWLFTTKTNTYTSISPNDVICCNYKLSLNHIPNNSIHSLIKLGWVAENGQARPQFAPDCIHPRCQGPVHCWAERHQGPSDHPPSPGWLCKFVVSTDRADKGKLVITAVTIRMLKALRSSPPDLLGV